MDILILIAAMILVGAIIAVLAGPIWKNARPIGMKGDLITAVIAAVVVGLIDYFVVPAMGFSDTLKWVSVAFEPALAALGALWVVRRVKQQ